MIIMIIFISFASSLLTGDDFVELLYSDASFEH